MSTEQAEKVQEIVAEGVAREGLQEMVLPAEEAAAKRLADFVSDAAIDRMIADAQDAGVSLLDGPGGLIGQLTARVIERALGAEMDDHLGYVKGDPAGNGSGNSRNGSYGKTLTTTSGPVRIIVPRDRKSVFEPQIVVKGQRRVGQVDEMILSLYARGMTTRDIHAHLAEIYGVEVSPALVSAVTDVVTDEITEWQNRPLDAFYAILYIDALVVKVRDGGAVDNKAAYLVTGVDADGYKHVLGIWLGTAEGSRFWAGVLAELRNRGIKDVLFVCCDGLNGLPDAIEATWPKAKVQTCVIHLIRASMKYVSWKDRKKAAAAMRPIYTALNEAAAKAALENLRRDFGKKSPGLVAAWERAWDQFIPFLEFDSAIRKVIYTTNAIESVNFQLRKIIKNRGHFPGDDAAVKLLYLGIRNITGRHIDGDGLVRERGKRGTGTYGWKAAMNAFAVAFGDRVPRLTWHRKTTHQHNKRTTTAPAHTKDLTSSFPDAQLGVVIPYGIYDLAANTGWVSVGTDHNTAASAAESIRRWWDGAGRDGYLAARRLLITADAGGSNGYQARAWKAGLAALAEETGLEITCCHFPPGTSKWNKIEHRLFAHITMNWRGRPLTSHQVVLNSIAATTTTTGLKVTAALDTGATPPGPRSAMSR